ncbi:MAG: PLDc N-terminal domain-containing protein [Vulcanimicrobiaceae bacterium]
MKLLLEILLAVILHPIAVVLMWIHLAGRDDLNGVEKVVWALVGIIWGIGPILYMLVGRGELW